MITGRKKKTDNEIKFDNHKQCSRCNCLVITGLPETEGEDTDTIIHNLFLNKLGINLDIYQIDRSHRLGPRCYRNDQTLSNCPIIVKFATYHSRKTVFNAKMSKGSGVTIFENLTKCRVSLLKEVQKIAGSRQVWTMGRNIFTFNLVGKVFSVKKMEDLKRVRSVQANNNE